MTAPTLPAGTIGISTIDGHTGAFVKLGQQFMGANKADSRWSHVFVVGVGDTVYEAMPAGIQRNKLSTYLADLTAGDEVMFINVPITDVQRASIVAFGDHLVDNKVGYSFRSYLYLFLRRIGWRTDGMKARIGQAGNMICSQTADVMVSSVLEVFTDQRAWQDVLPSDFPGLVRDDPRFTVIDTIHITEK